MNEMMNTDHLRKLTEQIKDIHEQREFNRQLLKQYEIAPEYIPYMLKERQEKLEEIEKKVNEFVEANRPKPVATTTYDFASLQTLSINADAIPIPRYLGAISKQTIEIVFPQVFSLANSGTNPS